MKALFRHRFEKYINFTFGQILKRSTLKSAHSKVVVDRRLLKGLFTKCGPCYGKLTRNGEMSRDSNSEEPCYSKD